MEEVIIDKDYHKRILSICKNLSTEERIYHHSMINPDKAAIIGTDGSVITFLQLRKEFNRAAEAFVKTGLNKGDRVILAAEKKSEFIFSYFGAHKAGIIVVPIDPEINSLRFEKIYKVTTPKLVLGNIRNNNTDIKCSDYISFLSQVELGCVYSNNPIEENVADIIFTTGTTGEPKGVALTNRNELAAATNINQFIGNSENDIELLALPLGHSFGLGRLRCALGNGQTVVFLNGFASMKKFFGAIEKYKVNGFGMVPASWAYISKMSGDKIGQFANQLKYLEIGSAPLSLNEKERLIKLLPHTKICMHYGLTEASRSSFISFNEELNYLDSSGKASPNTEIAIFSSEGAKLPSQCEGEVCVKGEHVCSSYWDNPLAFQNDHFGEYFRTGDWGYLDKDGYLHLKSRTKEMINVGGKKVSPMEVEEALESIDGIDEAACVAYPDPVMGEVVKAFVVGSLAPDDDKKILQQLVSKIENYKIPAYIMHITSLPKTESGKLQRLKLKKV